MADEAVSKAAADLVANRWNKATAEERKAVGAFLAKARARARRRRQGKVRARLGKAKASKS